MGVRLGSATLRQTVMGSTVEPFPHPLHPSIASRIDPEYEAFHNEKLLYHMHCHEVPWSPAVRSGPTVPGSSTPVKVGSVKDYSTTPQRKSWLRVFTPEGSAPEGGWPAFVFYHGVRSQYYGAISLADCAIGWLDIGEHRLGELLLFATLQE